MNTIILMWDPAIPPVSYREYKEYFRDLDFSYLNWSVRDWKKARAGDRFFLVRVGKQGASGKGNGIVMSGYLVSDPYRGTDWSGKGREVYYADLQPDYMFDTRKVTTLTDEFLSQAIPGFDWTGGHSGRILPAKDARVLEEHWARAVRGLEGVLHDPHKWSVARDVVPKCLLKVLYRAHYKGEYLSLQADFSRGWLEVYAFGMVFHSEYDAFLPELPETLPWYGVPDYDIRLSDLRKALGVEDDTAVARALYPGFMGADSKKRLLEFARKAGCKIEESLALME